MLQLLIKELFIEDNPIKLLLAKIKKLVCHFSHSAKACGIIKIIQVNFDHTLTKQKALLLVKDVDTKWNSTYLILKRPNKLNF